MAVLKLADASWPDLADRPMVLIPVGSLEQHGPHLPFDTDTAIAVAVAEQVAQVLAATDDAQIVLAPAIACGASGEHQAFAGTVSLGHDALRVVVVEMVRSIANWAGRIVLVNGHGGNVVTLSGALTQLIAEQHDVSWVPCAFETSTDAHAGHVETSVMLHLAPERVDMSRAVTGNTSSLAELMPALVSSGVAAVSPSGILGDPTNATAEVGAELFGELVQCLAVTIDRAERGVGGRLRRPAKVTVGGAHYDD